MKKKILTHVCAIVLLIVTAAVFFAPVFDGKAIRQGDMEKARAMSYEQKQFHDQTGTYTNWNSGMFSGMPAYQIYSTPQHNIFALLKQASISRVLGSAKECSFGVLLLYFLGFYIALAALGLNPWLSLLGALAFGFGSYNIIIIEAGHITKAWALSMMAPVLAGIILIFRKKYLWGWVLFTLALGLQIQFNHIQITYYTMIAALALGIVYIVYACMEKQLPTYLKGLVVILIGCFFAVLCNARHLMVNKEYSKYTMRGGTEISVSPNDLYKDAAQASPAGEKVSSGLQLDYAFNWSYGIGETFTLLVPGMYGGGSNERMGENTQFHQTFRSNVAPLYWGEQPFTSGPVYFGAVIVFLFVLGLFLVKGPERWWIGIATLLAILMCWGRNLMGFNAFLFHHLPLYNMFRTPSMSLVIANVGAVLLAVLALKNFLERTENEKELKRALYWSAGITAGLCLLFVLFANSFSYTGASDNEMARQYQEHWSAIFNVLQADRKSLLVSDCWRSIGLILATAALLWLYAGQKLKKEGIALAATILIVTFDLWNVDRRYLSDENYTNDRNMTVLQPAPYDTEIDRQAAYFGDKDYRVFNYAVNTFNDSYPSAFHHQVGGYHAAKLRRYQDVIDFYISREVNGGVLNMLNTRYIVAPDRERGYLVQRNPEALGNVWFVDSMLQVENANEEILALHSLNPADKAVINSKEFAEQLAFNPEELRRDSLSGIEMVHQTPYHPDKVVYRSKTTKRQLAVFSEIYYAPDWFAYIDGKPADYLRVNYILRGMVIPAGEHTIEFRNEAPTLHRWEKISIAGSVLLVLSMAGAFAVTYGRRRKKPTSTKTEAAA
ncbi:MAG: hypothetical protein J5873_01235 [Bacteroidales bacterium]|nr:hypothetical protein [Bacteroidales bacterium]